jgi:hypothetical protein
MDILNFISWIRGKRQVTSVDPAKTVIPLGVKDGRRDDDYLAVAMTVEDFAAQIVPTPVNIYNSNGTLTDDRIITGAGNYDLIFQNIPNFIIASSQDMQVQCAYKQVNLGTNSGNLTLLKLDDNAAYPVQVSGTNVSANTAGAASGQFLKIKVNGVDYKIALLNT